MLTHYFTNLPHIQPRGAAFFVTFRLEGSIAKDALKKWELKYKHQLDELKNISDEKERNIAQFNHRKKSFAEYDELIDKISGGPMYLQDESIMKVVSDQLHRFDGELYDLIAYCVMSNHVHILIDTLKHSDKNNQKVDIYDNHSELSYILKRIKGASARYANKELGISGRFWNKENYDIYIRNEKMLKNVIGYILENPVKAKIVKEWKDYPGNYLMSSEF